MKALANILTDPAFTGVAGIALGFVVKGIFDIFGVSSQLRHERKERQKERTHEAAMQEAAQREEERDRRRRTYARFLGMAQTIGNQMRNIGSLSNEDLKALAESYAETDVMAKDEAVRYQAILIFDEALNSSNEIIDTDEFVTAIRKEEKSIREEEAKLENQQHSS